MRHFIFILMLLSSALTSKADEVLIEAEQMTNKGGWVTDQQFMDLMGSPYLMAHGLGVPVADASTSFQTRTSGLYRLFVRTYNWTAPWTSKPGPGKFRVAVDKAYTSPSVGDRGKGWQWVDLGTLRLKAGRHRLVLHDLTGFNGRCDAIYLTTGSTHPQSVDDGSCGLWRRRLMGKTAIEKRSFDFVVVGGGIAGMCAAVTAARQGCKVALVNDRPVLGGNNSSEVRVHLGGIIETGLYKRLGRIIREFGQRQGGNAMPASFYEDSRKDSFIAAEPNITCFAGWRAVGVAKQGQHLSSVTIYEVTTGNEMTLEAPLFSDCTGDGTIGALAGADYRMGREGKSEFNESYAPEKPDSLVMGASVQWYSEPKRKKTTFPVFDFGLTFNENNAEHVYKGEWTWETGMNRNQITDAERIRDYGLLVVFSNWSWLKNNETTKDEFAHRELSWAAYVLGKRESRRLMGDYILSQQDIDKDLWHEDASFTTTWAIDLHFADSVNEAHFPGEAFKTRTIHRWIHPYAVPYRCLYSRNIDNLFMAGRDISCTHVALGTVRVMRTTGMMGEVVGMAASVCHRHKVTPREVYQHYLNELQQLMRQGAGKENVPDNQHFNEPNRTLSVGRAFMNKTAFARTNGDTLFLGNSQIVRTILLRHDSLRTLSVTDRGSLTLTNKTDANDLIIAKGRADSLCVSCGRLSPSTIHADGAQATVTFRIGSLQVKREYIVYDNAPAIVCNTWLRGKLKAALTKQTANNADNKNIESAADMEPQVRTTVLDRLSPGGNHWQCRAVEFFDYTDWNNNLVHSATFIPYRRNGVRGNLIIAKNGATGGGFFFLKEAPCPSTQLHYPGADFITEFGSFAVTGFGIAPDDVMPEQWTRAYTVVLGVFDGDETDALKALRLYQKQLRAKKAEADDMVMMNTWGDRSQDARINEAFCLNELDQAHRLGINVFQLDDGWQKGKSPNSKSGKGSFKDIWKDSLYWTPDPVKFPHGLDRVVAKARQLNMRIGLWFNPSIQDEFADWQKDAEAVLSLWRRYGITIFKIDGVQIPTKRAEQRLRNFFDEVTRQSGGNVIFNLDVTAGRRGGYNMFNEYGNIFLENRYTDWGNYYPYQTLRNLWQLAAYVPAERLQVEFLNKWRNPSKYGADPFAPARYSMDYLFAITMMAQPLAWMEASNLPDEAYSLGKSIKCYTKWQHQMHQGIILPVGEEPSGRSWTGFQSITDGRSGFLLVFREDNDRPTTHMLLHLDKGTTLRLQPLMGDGKESNVTSDGEGRISLTLPQPNDFCLYHYEVKE